MCLPAEQHNGSLHKAGPHLRTVPSPRKDWPTTTVPVTEEAGVPSTSTVPPQLGSAVCAAQLLRSASRQTPTEADCEGTARPGALQVGKVVLANGAFRCRPPHMPRQGL